MNFTIDDKFLLIMLYKKFYDEVSKNKNDDINKILIEMEKYPKSFKAELIILNNEINSRKGSIKVIFKNLINELL